MKQLTETHDPRGIRGTMNPKMEKPNPKILKKILNHLPRGTEGDKWYSFTGSSDLSKLRVWSFRPADLKRSQTKAAKALVSTIQLYISKAEKTRASILKKTIDSNVLCILVYAEDYIETNTGYIAGNRFIIYSGETGDVIMSDADINGLSSIRTGRIEKRPRARDAMTQDIANRIR